MCVCVCVCVMNESFILFHVCVAELKLTILDYCTNFFFALCSHDDCTCSNDAVLHMVCLCVYVRLGCFGSFIFFQLIPYVCSIVVI